MRRHAIHVFRAGEFANALSLTRFLKHHGIDAGIVTKHAVQIHPHFAQQAAAVLPAYRWGWDRREVA